MIVIPEKVEQLVKKLEKHEDDIESPWGLAEWMSKKGYKMPAAEKHKLPTPKEEEELDQYEEKLSDKVKKAEYDPTKGGKILAPKTAGEDQRELRKTTEKQWDEPVETPKKPKQTRPPGDLYSSEEYNLPPTPDVGPIKLPTTREEHDLKHFRTQVTGKKKALGIPKKAEEDKAINPVLVQTKQLERKDRPFTKSAPETIMHEQQTKLPPMKASEIIDKFLAEVEMKKQYSKKK